jgi:hypothetical protein
MAPSHRWPRTEMSLPPIGRRTDTHASMDPLPRLLVDLAQASARAHTEATLVDAITHTLQGHFALRSCTRTQTPVERSETRWVLPLATGALVAEVDAWPTWFDDDARHAVTAMIAVGFDHVAVLTRVAELSRRAHHDRRALRDELARHVAWDAPTLPSPAMRRLFDETLPAGGTLRRDDALVWRVGCWQRRCRAKNSRALAACGASLCGDQLRCRARRTAGERPLRSRARGFYGCTHAPSRVL